MKKINQEWKTTDQFGFIYIMSNPSFPYLLKIGKTTRTTIERAKEISSSSGVPTSFKIDYEIRTSSLESKTGFNPPFQICKNGLEQDAVNS